MKRLVYRAKNGSRPGKLVFIISSLMMIAGGGLIIASMIHIYTNPVDRAIYYIGVPGIVFGLINFSIGFVIGRRR